MKVLYAIQGTGNGHLSRAKDVIPALMKRVNVDVMISGIQADLDLPFPIKYRYHGLSFIFGKNGGVDVWDTFKKNKTKRLINEIRSCPVQDYDLVINDFEPVSAWACKIKGVKCISLSHQASLRSKNVPKPDHIDWMGSLVLKYYAPCHDYYSFHFKQYDEQMFTPVIRSEVREQEIVEKDHYTVYLPAYGDKKIIKVLSEISGANWHVFSKHSDKAYQVKNVKIEPVNGTKFGESLASSKGVLCGAGFETPAEALFLEKKLMVVPMKKQYEQHFNAEGLRDLGVPVIKKLSKKQVDKIKKWVKKGKKIEVSFPDQTQFIIDELLTTHITTLGEEIKKMEISLPIFKQA
ncbi:glycosyltransferase family protein [Reichenbachiella versicolor]|uniref:glycosyltransferase family protein n=1 Tax=Reichenbachiella versicolor TaxID=1821036 RepID=UPI000D6E29C8|nr:glycosyltransferase family protein [Reichenbachiella versicolor]